MIVAGFGFRAAATEASLLDAFTRATQHANGAAGYDTQPTHAAAPLDKSEADEFLATVARLALPVIAVGPDQLRSVETQTQSVLVIERRGVGSVAEAVALAAAGDGATLAGPRVVSSDQLATCAIAIGGVR